MCRTIIASEEETDSNLVGQKSDKVKEADKIKKIYNATMIYVNHVIYLIKKYNLESFTDGDFFSSGKDVPNIHKINFSFPHFLLDKVILHNMVRERSSQQLTLNLTNGDERSLESEVVQAFYLTLGLEGMCYWAFNIMDELTFDLEQLPDNIEWKHDIVKYYAIKMPDTKHIR